MPDAESGIFQLVELPEGTEITCIGQGIAQEVTSKPEVPKRWPVEWCKIDKRLPMRRTKIPAGWRTFEDVRKEIEDMASGRSYCPPGFNLKAMKQRLDHQLAST